MFKKFCILILVCLCFAITILPQPIFPQVNEKTELRNIAAGIDSYKNKTIVLRLKLKYVDNVFEKITFYDKRNHDIEFDISTRARKKKLKRYMLNLHEGLDYRVTFVVKDVGATGMVIGELKSFSPALLNLLPERR